MKGAHPKESKGMLCELFGISRQAFHNSVVRKSDRQIEYDVIVQAVKEHRKEQRNVGTRKLYLHLQKVIEEHGIKMGRDALNDLLRERGLLVRKRKRRVITTDSSHPYRKYPNLIKDYIPLKSNQLWVSDLTYLETEEGFAYIFFITDAYSHKVVGYHISQHMEASAALVALGMAIEQLQPNECPIHHSDRGSQYCCNLYIGTLQKHSIKVSMTENGDPYENAVAERLNGIVKNDLLPDRIATKQEAIALLPKSVSVYNTIRLHNSINNLTPEQAHGMSGSLPKLWKKKSKKAADGSPLETAKNPQVGLSEQGQALRVLT